MVPVTVIYVDHLILWCRSKVNKNADAETEIRELVAQLAQKGGEVK